MGLIELYMPQLIYIIIIEYSTTLYVGVAPKNGRQYKHGRPDHQNSPLFTCLHFQHLAEVEIMKEQGENHFKICC